MNQGENNGVYRYVIFGDHQIQAKSHYEAMLDIAKAHIEDRYQKPIEDAINLIVHVGDQVDRGTLDEYQNVKLDKNMEWNSNVASMTVVGNHETYDDPGLAQYFAHFKYDHLNYNGIESTAPSKEAYYAYKTANMLFIMMSSEHANDTQLNWLNSVVQEAEADDQIKWVFADIHRPPYAESYTGDVSSWYRDQVLPILNQSSKRAMDITGHHHLYARGQYEEANAYHIISGAASWRQHWDLGGNKGDHRLVQKTLCQYAYQIVEIDLTTDIMTVESFAVGDYYRTDDENGSQEYYFEKIDEFKRKLNQTVKPETPSILNVTEGELVTLPFEFESSNYTHQSNEELNTTWFQISNDSSFNEIQFDAYRDFENWFYEDPATKLPVDLNAGIDILKAQVPASGVFNGTNYIRIRHRDKNTIWSDWSTPVRFEVEGGADNTEPNVRTDKQIYTDDEEVTVYYSNAPTTPNTWIPIVNQFDDGYSYLRYSYIPVQSFGSINISALNEKSKGDDFYYVQMFVNDGYESYGDPHYFYIGDVAQLTTTDIQVGTGETVTVSISNAPGNKPNNTNDQLAVYRQGADKENAEQVIQVKDLLSNGSGDIPVNELADGFYYANYFTRGGDRTISDPVAFRVGSRPSNISATKGATSYAIGEPIEVSVRNGVYAPDDWIGIYSNQTDWNTPGNDEFYRFMYVDEPNQKVTFEGTNAISGTPQSPGKYKLGYFPNSGYDLVCDPLFITVGYVELIADSTNNVSNTAIIVGYSADNQWVNSISAVKVDGETVNEANYEIQSDGIVFSSGLFTQTGNFNIDVESDLEGYNTSSVVQPIVTGQTTTQNLIQNHDFESLNSSIDPWFNAWDEAHAPEIKQSAKFTGSFGLELPNSGGVVQLIPVSPNTDYILTFWGKSNFSLGLEQYENGDKSNNSQVSASSATYKQYSMSYNSGSVDTLRLWTWGNAAYSLDKVVMWEKSNSNNVPSAPSGINTFGTRSWIKVSWTDNANNETGYNVYWSNSTKPSSPNAIIPSGSEYYIDDLTENTSYNVWVEAFNDGGASSSITASQLTEKDWSGYFDPAANLSPASTANVPEGMELVFHDEFDHPLLDRNKWTTDYYSLAEAHQLAPINPVTSQPVVGINDGVLTLTCNDAQEPHWAWTWEGIYYEHKVATIQTFDWYSKEEFYTADKGGYFEVRVKHTDGNGGADAGNHTAFWLDAIDLKYQLATGESTHGVDGITHIDQAHEIDIFEQYGNYGNSSDFVMHGNGLNSSAIYYNPVSGNFHDGNFHTHGLLWEANMLKYYVDGVLMFTMSDITKIPDYPLQTILNLYLYQQRGWVWGEGNYNSFEIDYFRAYEYTTPDGNQIHNGEFEFTSEAPWGLLQGSAISSFDPRNGSKHLLCNDDQGAEQHFYLDANTDYVLEMWVKGGAVSFGMEDITPGTGWLTSLGTVNTTANSEYTKYTLSFTTADMAEGLTSMNRLWVWNSFGNPDVYIDNVKIIIDTTKSVTSSRSISDSNYVSVYPNPAKDRIRIQGLQIDSNEDAHIELYNLDGKKVIQRVHRFASAQSTFDLELGGANLPVGQYLLKIYTSSELKYSGKVTIIKN